MNIDKLIWRFIWRSTKPRIANLILKKNKVWALTLPAFKSYYKARVIKIVWYLQKNGQVDQQKYKYFNISHKYSQLIINKGAKTVFSTNGLGTTGYPHAKKKKNSHRDFIPFTKINSKWITDLNVKHKIIKLLEDNTGENLDDLGYDDDFLDTTPKAPSIKERIDKTGIH